MTETAKWWRAHLGSDEEVIWHGPANQRGAILSYRVPFLFFRTLAVLILLVIIPGLILGDLKIVVGSLFMGGLLWLISVHETQHEELYRAQAMFVVSPNRALALGPNRVINDVEIDGFLHFEPSKNGIHFPRRNQQWPAIDDPTGNYEALNKAQRLQQ